MVDALAGVPGLKVVAAPSPAGGEADVKRLGAQLGVATVLGASVRREGARVRVSARLSDARTGFTLWAHSYDRETGDVFALQSDIAGEVVQALIDVLPSGEIEAARQSLARRLTPTRSVAAYDAYLKGEQRMREKAVPQLDTRREQVLVEAIIVEISDNAAKRLGVQFLLGGLPGSGVPFAVTNYSNSAPNLLAIAGAVGARELGRTTTTINGSTVTTSTNSATGDALEQAAVNSLLNSAGSFGGFAGKLGGDAIFATIINAIKSDNTSNILSTPSIMTLDNQEAKILVGQEIPVTTGEALSDNFDNAFRTVQRQNVGIQLEVKPQINQGGAIKLFLRQEVSSIAGPVSDNFNDLILNKREIETTVTVDDGQIIALGGLLDENERRTLEKIPLLGDIPGIGQLFRSRARERAKTNLMVFIRPTIVRSAADARAITDRRFDYTRADLRARRPEQEPGIDVLVREYMGATPPGTLVTPPPAPVPPQ